MSPRLAIVVAILIVGTAVLPAALAVASGSLVGSIEGTIGEGWGSPSGERLVARIVLVVVLFVLQQLSGPALRSLAESLGRRVDGRLRLGIMGTTLAPAGVAHLEDAAVVDRIAEAQSVGTSPVTVTHAVTGMAVVAANGLAAVVAAAVLATYRWWLAAGLLAAHVVTTWIRSQQLSRTVAALRGQTRRFRRSSYFRDLALTPAAAKELRVFGLGPWIGDRFAEAWSGAMADFWRDRPKGRWVPPACALILGAVLGLTYALLGHSAARGEISVGDLTMFAAAAIGVAAFSTIGVDNLNISYGTAAVPAGLELHRAVGQSRFELPGERTADGLPSSGIRFTAVSFQYPGCSTPVFRDLHLDIPARRSLAIVGANGAGKTTLVKLLTRLYDPTDGQITVDGINLATVDARAWQRRVAAIFQDFVHYQLSASDNVGFGDLERAGNTEAVVAAARRAGADEIIDRLPFGWETVLSRRTEGGVELSGGQWQRVALARALLAVDGGASVLILDEPTAALDVRAEAAFYDRFLELTAGITTIVISHRFSTVRRADRIVVLEDGRVTEAGDHASLVATGGRYAHMFGLQAAHLLDDRPRANGA